MEYGDFSKYKYHFMAIKHRVFRKPSYSQHREDLVIQHVFGRINRFVDIGANDGVSCSNTFLFALDGAAGLCFEPVTKNFAKLSRLYFFNSRIKCIKYGISNKFDELTVHCEGLLSYIEDTQDPWGAENLTKFMSGANEVEKIKVSPLANWIDDFPEFSDCDLVSLDVEGHELEALQGFDFDTFSTKCIIVEVMQGSHHKYEPIKLLLEDSNYVPLIQNRLNTFWFNGRIVSNQLLKKLKEVCQKFIDYNESI